MLIPFDILYEGFCNKLRTSGRAEAVLQSVKKEKSDSTRVRALLKEEPEIFTLLLCNINESYVRKDENIAKKLWQRGTSGGCLELLTEALSCCPIPSLFEEKLFCTFDSDLSKRILQDFVECPMTENNTLENNTMVGVLYDRACALFSRKRHEFAFKDFLRAWLLGLAKSLDLTYKVAVCCYECDELDCGKELLQRSAQHLRTLPMTNEDKSKWTMDIVKALKAIESLRKSHRSGTTAEQCRLSMSSTARNTLEANITLFRGESMHISSSSTTVEHKFSQEKGRYLIAREKIPPGATIIAEMPYVWTLSKANYYKFCLWCLRRTDTGLPCTKCASVIFCDAACRQLANNAFHGKECKILKLLDSSLKLGNMALLCFRTIVSTPLSTVQEFGMKIDRNDISEENSMGLNEKGKLDSTSYSSVFAQTPNDDHRQAGDLLKRTFSAIYLTLCLKYIGYFNEPTDFGISDEKMSDHEMQVAALILRHLQSASCNAYGINHTEKKIDMKGEEELKHLNIEEIGGATYPIISTTNHSCNPNAYRLNVSGKMCLVKTLRNICIGEEIYDCYGPLYLTECRHERISKLQTQYLFRCNCSPCTEDWPTYAKLKQTAVRHKCSSCSCQLKVDQKNINNKIKCPYCDNVIDMKKLLTGLGVQKERFDLVKTTILAEAFLPFDTDIESIICEYIGMCQKIYSDPCMYSVEAQEILKLFWNLSIRNS